MAGLHRDLEWERKSLDVLAIVPLSSAMPAPAPDTVHDALNLLVEHAQRAGASQLHLAPNSAPVGRFDDVLRPFAGLDRYDGQALTSMLESALDPPTIVLLDRTGSVSRIAFVPPFGWLRVHVWHERDGVRGIVHLPRRNVSRVRRLAQAMARALTGVRR